MLLSVISRRIGNSVPVQRIQEKLTKHGGLFLNQILYIIRYYIPQLNQRTLLMEARFMGKCSFQHFAFFYWGNVHVCSSIRRFCVSHSVVWFVKAATDLWLCRTPGGSPTTGSFCSMTHYCTHRYTHTHANTQKICTQLAKLRYFSSVCRNKSPQDLCQVFQIKSNLCLPGVSAMFCCKVYICTLYLSITQGAIPSQSLVSISATSLLSFTSNHPVKPHWALGGSSMGLLASVWCLHPDRLAWD